MKFEKNNRYFTIAVYAFSVIAASIIFFFILLYPDKLLGGFKKMISILTPLIIGFVIAFILNPLLNIFERKLFKKILPTKKQAKTKRALCLTCTYLVFAGILALFFSLVIPSIARSVADLASNIQGYYNSGIRLITEFLQRFNVSSDLVSYFNNLGSDFIGIVLGALNDMVSYLPKVFDMAMSATSAIKNIVVGLALSVYMLSSKEVFKRQAKILLGLYFKPQTKHRIIRVVNLSHDTFSRYLSAYIVDSAIVGLVCYAVMSIFGWPYPALVAIIIGFTNMIPFFGPFIGAIPSALLILLVNPLDALFFVIFIVILQQIDGNIICPRVLGHQIGLKPFWVMVAIVIGGSLFGVLGLIISVPTLAVIYALMRNYVARKVKEKEQAEEVEVL